MYTVATLSFQATSLSTISRFSDDYDPGTWKRCAVPGLVEAGTKPPGGERRERSSSCLSIKRVPGQTQGAVCAYDYQTDIHRSHQACPGCRRHDMHTNRCSFTRSPLLWLRRDWVRLQAPIRDTGGLHRTLVRLPSVREVSSEQRATEQQSNKNLPELLELHMQL